MAIHWDQQPIADEAYGTQIEHWQITIYKEHERWFLTCELLGFRDKPLKASVLDFVKREALRTVGHYAREKAEEMTMFLSELIDKQNA